MQAGLSLQLRFQNNACSVDSRPLIGSFIHLNRYYLVDSNQSIKALERIIHVYAPTFREHTGGVNHPE
jgi:hypothetical protein